MTDYRDMDPDFHNPDDPFRRDAALSPDAGASNTIWGWVAAAVFIVALLAVGFGIWGKPQSNDMNTAFNGPAPQATHIPPPAPMPAPTMAPAPATPSAPVIAAPSAPGPTGQVQ
ncbi:MAG: hypothetical protein WAL80_04750 [Xanthobacteraceae bacterium]|jgi:hypothetical protein